jgi:hypothetical protein
MPQAAVVQVPSEALLGYGSRFLIESLSSPNVYEDLGEVFNITPPSATVDQVDVTHMQSPDRRREFISGLIDGGECSFEMNYIPGPDERRRTCRIIYPNSIVHTFDAELTGYEPSVPTDDKMTATVTFKVTGSVTRESLLDSPET